MRTVAVLALGLLLTFHPSAAQQPVLIKGRVLVGDSAVAGQPVALHRVTATGGETLAADTSANDGTFELTLGTPQAGALHFVAARYQGKLYTGVIMRDEFPEDYVLRVGPGATPLDFGPAAASGAAPAPQRQSPVAGLAVVLGTLLLLGGLIALAARRRAPLQRQLLVEIADLDNRHEVTPIPQYAEQREELLRRLRESA